MYHVTSRPTALLRAAFAIALSGWIIGGQEAGAQHTARQTKPIQLGTSGGSIDDLDFPFCCGGTLGALVQNASGQYILSNNHVIARSNRATVGEGIVHPGLIDVGCAKIAGDVIADLSPYIPISFTSSNLFDAAIAAVRTGSVKTDGSILEIGPLSSTTVAPFLNQSIKKSGRTTGLTFGTVQAVDVTVSVTYPSKCGRTGGSTAVFTNQFRTTDISDGGDSGSVVVEDLLSAPRAVGLLFAGSSTTTLASPMDAVLAGYGVAMVGGTPPSPTVGSISGTVTSSSGGGAISGATVSTDTGQQTATDGSGAYSLTDVPTGTRTVTAAANGFVSQDQSVSVSDGATETANFVLSPVPSGGGNAIVRCIMYETYAGPNNDKHLRITVSVEDGSGSAVSGASVSVAISRPSGGAISLTATTNSAGFAVFEIKNAANGCYSTDVTSIAATGLTFDGSEPANGFQKGTDQSPDADCIGSSDSCGSSSGTSRLSRGTGIGRPDPQKLSQAIGVKRRFEAALLSHPGVAGVGVSAVNGNPVIEVYLVSGGPGATDRIPARLENIPVRPLITGEFFAGGGPARIDAMAVQACAVEPSRP